MRTYGFDYAFALSIDAVNAIMARNLAVVQMTIAYDTVDEDSGSKLHLTAQLAPWQIVPGGQNSLLNLNIPIVKGSLTLEGAIQKTYDLAGVTPEMQITLGWIGTGSRQDATGQGDATHLTFDPNDSTDKHNPGYVATVQIHDPQKRLDTIGLGILNEVMAGALYSNKEKIKYIFANVEPKPNGVHSWLTPAQWRYFYAGSTNFNALCFLCMLAGSGSLPAMPAFDSTAIRANSNVTLLVAQPKFFTNIVLPAVQRAFPGGRFALSTTVEEVCTIGNNGTFNVGALTASSFALSPSDSGNGLKMRASGGGPLKFLFGLADLPNASYSWSLATINPLRFNGHLITFDADRSPVMTHDQTIPWYDWVLLVVVGIIDLPGLIAAIVGAITGFYDVAERDGIATINNNLQAATGRTVANLARLVAWEVDGKSLTPADAGLSGALYVHGTLG